MKEVFSCVERLSVVFVVAAAIWLAAPAPEARAHDWYPFACCHDRDCRPVDSEAVQFTPGGWRITNTGETIPFDRARVSPDGRFHVCSYGGKATGKTICLFTPGMGS